MSKCINVCFRDFKCKQFWQRIEARKDVVDGKLGLEGGSVWDSAAKSWGIREEPHQGQQQC